MPDRIVFETEPKTPADRVNVGPIDIANLLLTGESISGAGAFSVTIKDKDGNDVTSTIFVSASLVFSANKVQFQVQAGTHNNDYTADVAITITSSPANRTVHIFVKIPVRTRPH